MDGKCEIVMERSLNEHWSVDNNGQADAFLGDGGASEFGDYLCLTHNEYFDDWPEVLGHKAEINAAA